MFFLYMLNLVQRTLVGRHMAHDTHPRDDGPVLFQPYKEVAAGHKEKKNEDGEPEIRSPLSPFKGIVLHILRREELVGMQRVHIYGNDLQSTGCALISLSVDLHLESGDGIDVLIERSDRISFLHFHLTPGAQRVRSQRLHNLHPRCHILTFLELRPLQLSPFGESHGKPQFRLFANQHGDRVNCLLHRHLGLQPERKQHQANRQYISRVSLHYFSFFCS